MKLQVGEASLVNRPKKWVSNNLKGYIFISPWLIGFLSFMVFPMFMSLYYSFTKYNLMSAPEWVGLKNYAEIILNDPKFIKSLKVTFTYVLASAPLRLIFALFLAVLFNQSRILTDFYRAAYYIPSILGGSVAISVTWRQLFGYNGAFNDIMLALGWMERPISWVGNPNTALWTLIVLAIWQFGSPMIIFLAGLRQIPTSLYESASIDGAGWWQRFFKITLPMLTPVIFFNLVMQIIRLFLMFTRAYIITQGGPINSTLVYALYLFRRAFKYQQMGYGSALAWILLIIITAITIILFKTSNRWVYYQGSEK